MTFEIQLIALTFTGSVAAVILVTLLVRRQGRIEARLRDDRMGETATPGWLARWVQSTLPKLGLSLLPSRQEQQNKLKVRMIHAGYYGRNALPMFLGLKMLLMILPLIIVGLAISFGWLGLIRGLSYGLVGCAAFMVLPNLWLDRRKQTRQTILRRGLPDVLDMIGLSVEGGMSLPAAFEQVVQELRMVHPLLMEEMDIVRREMQLGRTPGAALESLADRTDMEEAHSLALAVLQSERLGSGLVKTLRVTSDTLRLRRIQKAEETAHKASTKIVFPTVLCIFPAMFIVILGPAVIHISETLLGAGGP